MNEAQLMKRRRIAAGVASALVLLVILSIHGAVNHKSTGNGLAPTTISSPFSAGTNDLLVNYHGSQNNNSDAAQQYFIVFNASNLPLPTAIRNGLHDYLAAALAKEVSPVSGITYIQVDASTIKCPDQYDCRLSFYLDSPERYYDFHLYYQSDGSQAYTLIQKPLPGIKS